MDEVRSQVSESDSGQWTRLDDLDAWDPWHVSVRVATMPDGSPAITGLVLDPRDDFEGSVREQRITAERLRRLPMRHILASALVQRAISQDLGVEVVRRLDGEAFGAAIRDRNRERRLIREKEVGTDQERLEWAAQVYEWTVSVGQAPRPAVANALGVSVRTVDRLLAEARRRGLLTRYQGAQGKYGKDSATEEED